ncbi:MAG TPA: Rap1a/Tai family immunity protein [Steroidobacteraceae bacterium]|nr:Rap1a/Tai family immunity protein [Steroidobacteraceae bacterium]
MSRLVFASLALILCSGINAQPQPLPGRYFTPATLLMQMNRPNDQLALVYLMGAYDRTQDAGQSCAQRGTTTPILLAKVVSDYLTAHPELRSADRTAAGVAAQAFAQYWPCHVASQPSATASESLPTMPADLDDQFVCPEALSNDQARTDALRAFFNGIAREVPHATVLDFVHFRFQMLQKHGCKQTLQHLEAAVPPTGDEPGQKTWLPVQIAGPPGETLAISDVGLVPVIDPRFPAEPTVGAYVKLMFPAPRETNVTHVTYDTVISHNIYYCGTARYALVENDYFLSGKQTLKDPSPSTYVGATTVYAIDPIAAGSPDAAVLPAACRAIGASGAQAPVPVGRYFTPENFGAQIGHGNDQFAQIYLMGAYDLTQDTGQSCAQRGTTTPVLLEKVYSDYLIAHPELSYADRTAAGIAAQAFVDYWPCHK